MFAHHQGYAGDHEAPSLQRERAQGCGQNPRGVVQPAVAQVEALHLQFPYPHGAASSRARDRADAHQPSWTPPREGEVAAVLAKGDLGEEAVGGGGLPRTIGRWVWRSRAAVLGLEPFADRVADAKKLPLWLVRNGRPVMLEPYLRRLETGVV